MISKRYGFATNSSSSHSIVFLKNEKDASAIRTKRSSSDFKFGWENFILKTEKDKVNYLAAMIYENIKGNIPVNMIESVTSEYLGEQLEGMTEIKSKCNNDIGIDHGSVIALPRDWDNTDFLNKDFMRELTNFIKQKGVIIIGGNGNEESQSKITSVNGTFLNVHELSDPNLHNNVYSKDIYVARRDSLLGCWTLFNRHTGKKIRLQFPDGIKPVQVNNLKTEYPELVDILITNQCLKNCEYCYQNSTPNGKHADQWDIHGIIEVLRKWKVFEVAIGGGDPTLHPNFKFIIDSFKEAGIVPNFSVKDSTWLKSFTDKEIKDIINKVGAIGVSLDNYDNVEEILKSYYIKFNNLEIPMRKITVHLIPNLWGECGHDLEYLFENVKKFDILNILLLGYKDMERGKKYSDENQRRMKPGNAEYIIKKHKSDFNIGIDTVLAKQIEPFLTSMKSPKYLYDTVEGCNSMAIDAVKMKVGAASHLRTTRIDRLKHKEMEEGLKDEWDNNFYSEDESR